MADRSNVVYLDTYRAARLSRQGQLFESERPHFSMPPLPIRTLTPREVDHRQRMLRHLATASPRLALVGEPGGGRGSGLREDRPELAGFAS